MGATESKREPKGPGTSRVPEMFTDDIEVLDFKSKLRIVRVYWVRKELKETVSKRHCKNSLRLYFQKTPLVICHGWGGGAGYFFKLNNFVARDRGYKTHLKIFK